ncbi:hypothetical protein Pelo_8861 [Pelomyxa schiedti]|nr:hypothetical protein Pelo_8861 [Pelomyxa schiedti]
MSALNKNPLWQLINARPLEQKCNLLAETFAGICSTSFHLSVTSSLWTCKVEGSGEHRIASEDCGNATLVTHQGEHKNRKGKKVKGFLIRFYSFVMLVVCVVVG